uniref:Multiple myeloma tumor-associated protein 2-like N-terminal domain-containing protein n=1 Tax=Dunaliella tertiolecta TaxID=3047 RepID=A0A7S3VK53_DUNTE|mmetsp:Transcript_17549/g.48920  ORF Transcript_17549/g.48920 Transcript_17549/m.48920 type:complete len:426 (+) Transcript_17549:25-1302(+)
MSLHNGPIRPGARGGRGEFSWDKVRGDQDASYYIGHSVKALSGRWQKGKDVYWYTREKSGQAVSVEEERRAVKQREEELMLEALGLKPKSLPTEHKPMDQKELDAIIKKNAPEKEEGAEQGAIKGLGFAPGASVGGGVAVHAKLEGVGVGPSDGAAARAMPAGPSGTQHTQPQHLPPPPPLPRGGAAAAAASGGLLNKAQIKQLAKVDKKAAKAAKKARKKAKREAKRAKKEHKREAKGLKRCREGGGAEEVDKPSSKRGGHSRRSRSPDSGSSSSSSGGSEGSSSSGEDRGRGRTSLSPPPPAKASQVERAREGVVGERRRQDCGDDGRRREVGHELEGRGGGRSSRGERHERKERSTEGGGGGGNRRQRHDSPAEGEEVSGREGTRSHRQVRRERSRSRDWGREDSRAQHRSSRGDSRERRRR